MKATGSNKNQQLVSLSGLTFFNMHLADHHLLQQKVKGCTYSTKTMFVISALVEILKCTTVIVTRINQTAGRDWSPRTLQSQQ